MISNVFDAKLVLKPLFGKIQKLKSTMKDIGSNFGSTTTTLFATYVNYQDTATLKSKPLNDFGFKELPNRQKIWPALNI